jgi:hypothetical protein
MAGNSIRSGAAFRRLPSAGFRIWNPGSSPSCPRIGESRRSAGAESLSPDDLKGVAAGWIGTA